MMDIKAFLLDLFFPNRCPFCDGFIRWDRLCCSQCFDNALWADDNICLGCGKSILKGCMCSDEKQYDMCVIGAYYSEGAKDCILNLKFHSNTNGAEIMGKVLHDRLAELELLDKIDAAIPVPMTKKQKSRRGYNQAELIARAITKGTDIPVITDLLERKNAQTAQHLLSAEERQAAVSQQYFALQGSLKGKTVLLTDDVLTTGSTLNYCAWLLKNKLHAKKVICAAAVTA